MNQLLTDVDIRVLGALIEKEKTTPDNYPLSLNALVSACNQSSNRDPVVAYDVATVEHAIDHLRRQGLVRAIKRVDSRVMKYQHLLDEVLALDVPQVALLCVMMLRGPQTLAELKTRSARLLPAELVDAEGVLQSLIDRTESALVAKQPRRPGQKEPRYIQLFSGETTVESSEPVEPPSPVRHDAALVTESLRGDTERPAEPVSSDTRRPAEPVSSDVGRMAESIQSHAERITALEASMELLRREVTYLRSQLERTRRPFD